MAASPKGTLPPVVAEELVHRFGQRFSTSASVCDQHVRGESPFPPAPPDAVVFTTSTEEVQYVLSLPNRHAVPAIAFGAGSSLEGQLRAVRGGVSLDLSLMNRIEGIDIEDFSATLQAGVTREDLNLALKGEGVFFPVDSGAHATIGGMAATRASGTTKVRYGSMRKKALAPTLVTADERVIQTGSRAVKSAAGYDLTRLLVGSEGTLGVITEVTVRFYPQPHAVSAAVVSFAGAKAAVATVMTAIQAGLPVARSEYLCASSIRAINAATPGLNLREQPTPFLEFLGSPASILDQSSTLIRDLAGGLGGADFQWAEHPEDRIHHWLARHNAYHACRVSRQGSHVIATDTCVPRSHLSIASKRWASLCRTRHSRA